MSWHAQGRGRSSRRSPARARGLVALPAGTASPADRPGAFVSARGGALFPDEFGELAADLQPKLLRAIESRRVKPGASREVYVLALPRPRRAT